MGDEVFDRKTGGGSSSTILMEQQKMNCALQRSCSNTQKTTDWENNSVSTKSLEENNFSASSNVCEVSSLAWRNSDHKCAVLAFFAVEPHGHWRITLPMQCPEPTIHLRSGSQVKMDGLHLVSPPLVNSVRVDQQKGRRGPTSERSSSIKSFTTRKFSGSNLQYQSRNKGLPNNVSRWNALLGNSSCQTSLNSCDSSVMIPTGCNATSSSDTQISLSKADKSIRRNPKKKARKKGNRNKKPGSANLEYVHGSSTSETGVTKNADYVIAPLPCTTRLAVLSPGRIRKHGDSDGNSSGNVSSSETPKICTSYIEGDILETNIIGEHCSPNNYFPEFPIFSGLQDTNSKPIGCSNDPCSSVFSETNESSVLDSTSVCSDGEKVIEASCKLSTKGIGGTNLSESPGYIPRNGLFSLPNMLNSVEDSNCHIRETTYREAKRGKQSKHVHRNSSISRLSSSEKFSGRSGKENNHSIWQKVQRNDNDECRSGLRKVNSANSQSGAGLKEVPLPKKKCNGPQSNILSTCEGKSQSKVKASRKVKRKTSPGLKQELNYYSRRGSYATKASSNVCRKINMKQNEVLDIPAELGGKKGLDSISGSCSEISGQVESIMSEPAPILEGRPNELEPLEHVCASLSSLNDQTSKRESSSLSAFCDYQDLTELLEGQSTGHLYPPGGESNKINQNVSPGAHNKQEQSCESTLRRWIPVGMKDYELASSVHSNSLQLAHLSKPSGEVCPLENTSREMTSDADTSSTNASIMHGDQAASVQIGVHSQDEVQIEKHPSQSTCTPKESCVNQVAVNCLTHVQRDKIYSAVENESNKIAQAVNDAYRVQLASEVVQMATGSPIAEFERLLSSASPVISLPHNISSCEICLPDEIVGSPLCRHEMPNISLGSLWQWYEKHGTYGLEVRAKEYDNPKRFGTDSVAFRAYFVPFLSAVQLFRNFKSPSDRTSRAAGTEAMEEACTFNKRPGNSSNVGCLPIFSVLFPQPHMDTSSLSARNSVCCSEMSSVFTEGNESIQSNDSTSSDDLELIFEYFEVEQPQNRRPLFEMIKELVGGGGPSQCRAYGDPTKLDSVTLNDLHHKSWYSVAWYPIYRIPDDNFRAAFLTYHSLGHLVHQSVTSDSLGVGACVVSPVVGLQSYNAQGECWFQLRQLALMSQTTEIPNSNPSRILKERLRTLEQTASLMARAAVTKGNLTSVNRQPDYEFFLSRRRW